MRVIVNQETILKSTSETLILTSGLNSKELLTFSAVASKIERESQTQKQAILDATGLFI
jgi:hypothetical protein